MLYLKIDKVDGMPKLLKEHDVRSKNKYNIKEID